MDNREKHLLLAEYLKNFENYQFGKMNSKQYGALNHAVVEKLLLQNQEEPCYQLMKASVLIEDGRREEAEALLKKYERNHILQMKNPDFRAGFLYLAAKLTDDIIQRRQIVSQLQKLYKKNPAQDSLYYYLAKLDEVFVKNPRKKIIFLEKQWKLGNKQNLLYVESILTLRKNPEVATDMNAFIVQLYIWAVRRRVLTKEMGAQIARTAIYLKGNDAKYEYLLRYSYQFFSTKELLGALCSFYIRNCRTDQRAAEYYEKGVEFQLKLANLYEYYMMATAKQSRQLLPEQVLLYFMYHNTLSSSQKAHLYRNIVCYGDPDTEIYEKYKEQIEGYTLESLLQEKISPEHAYLYEKVLFPEIFTEEMAQAMTKLMFLRKIQCSDPHIKEVEVSYEQLKMPMRYPLRKGYAYIPIYTPNAKITLVDERGNLYRNTVAYELTKLLEVKHYVEACKELVSHDAGLLLYLCESKGERHQLNEDTIGYYYQIPDTEAFTEKYRNSIMLEVMEYEMRKKRTAKLPEHWFADGGQHMEKQQRAKYLKFLVDEKLYEQAFLWIEQYGSAYVPANTILKIVSMLDNSRFAESELYYRLCYGTFKSGLMNYQSLKFLAAKFFGTCAQMAEIWQKAKAFGVNTGELEERILVQMMFTETEIPEHFEIFLSYCQRTPDEMVRRAYLSDRSRRDFAQNQSQDSRFYFLLEEELFQERGGNEICRLAYLKYLSGQTVLSVRQKNLAADFLKEFFARKCYYRFMRKFGRIIPEALVLEDKIFIEYYAPESSTVMLHYTLEKQEHPSAKDYLTAKLYPVYGGMYTACFTAFYGETLTYYITEQDENGKIHSTEVQMLKKENSIPGSGTGYERINEMRKLEMAGRTDLLKRRAEEFAFLEMAAEKLFVMK